jgi:hypothetical protein
VFAPRRSAAVLILAAALAFPAVAVAQSAGDNQYEDPFGGQGSSGSSQSSSGSGSSSGSSGSSSGQSSGSLSGSSSGSAGASSGSSSAAGSGSSGSGGGGSQGSASGQQLARTGSETWLVALAGGGLLLTGVGLRLRLRGKPE